MTEFSKLVSEQWKRLTRDEKTELQRKYQINRDKKSQQNTVSECVTVIGQRSTQLYTTNGDNEVSEAKANIQGIKNCPVSKKASLSNVLNKNNCLVVVTFFRFFFLYPLLEIFFEINFFIYSKVIFFTCLLLLALI